MVIERAIQETPFLGPKFHPGDKVKFANPANFQDVVKNIDPSQTFTVKSVEEKLRPGTGEHDDIGDYNYQEVELEELSLTLANNHLILVQDKA
jgi:hypothetical protein